MADYWTRHDPDVDLGELADDNDVIGGGESESNSESNSEEESKRDGCTRARRHNAALLRVVS